MRDRLAWFGVALMNPELPVPPGVVGPDGRPSLRRFNVYRNNVVVSLVDALAAGFPVVQRLVGEEFFRAMARVFASRRPPDSPIMLSYGEGFAAFIASFPPAASVPYLADVARLERAWAEAYHAAEATPIGAADLAGMPPERFLRSRPILHPSLRLVRSTYPIVAIWHMNLPGGSPASLDLSAGEAALVLRSHSQVDVRRLSAESAGFVASLIGGATPAEAARTALRIDPRFDVASNLADVIGLGLLVGWTDAANAGGRNVA